LESFLSESGARKVFDPRESLLSAPPWPPRK